MWRVLQEILYRNTLCLCWASPDVATLQSLGSIASHSSSCLHKTFSASNELLTFNNFRHVCLRS